MHPLRNATGASSFSETSQKRIFRFLFLSCCCLIFKVRCALSRERLTIIPNPALFVNSLFSPSLHPPARVDSILQSIVSLTGSYPNICKCRLFLFFIPLFCPASPANNWFWHVVLSQHDRVKREWKMWDIFYMKNPTFLHGGGQIAAARHLYPLPII